MPPGQDSTMAKPSISVPDELLEEFDQAITRQKALGDIPQDSDRSSVVRMLMREFVDETDEKWGNSLAKSAMPMSAD